MKTLFKNYFKTFEGLSREVWWLALITFINRSGTMVIPFLTLYLNENLSFSLSEIAWIMSCYGVGSVVGTWLGGKLTDQIGYYKVMVRSLFSTGIVFIALQFLTSLSHVCLGIFLVMVVADTFRPAMFVAMSVYSKPENKTRSVTLIRLAINLGFSAGPAIGGLIIAHLGYGGLFWVDGITCILATLLLIKVLNPRVAKPLDDIKTENPESAYKDKPYWVFFLAMFLFAAIFMQYFSTMPLYYRNIHELTEVEIGLLLGFNGFVIVVLEMPLIHWLDRCKYNKIILTSLGIILTLLSFTVLNLTSYSGILIMSILLMTIGEMIGFPYSNAFAMERSKKGKKGQYLAMYLMAFSLANVFAHNGGLQLIDHLGYDATWHIMSALGVLGVFLLYILNIILKNEASQS
ncbi:MAG: MFS transporter [Winogradskyella sp.]|uniref:MDR family MFS transporter n=1 Tax=Winogradskyella sp. TaxID=1883156 RepID=UPI0025F2D7B7|nr:MFS transporter [Winogradskyella sp.]NRB58489.1 MFS transporter [Winogradskyella sp.]